jgi:hypothetical protein
VGAVAEVAEACVVSKDHFYVEGVEGVVDGQFDRTVIVDDTQFYALGGSKGGIGRGGTWPGCAFASQTGFDEEFGCWIGH